MSSDLFLSLEWVLSDSYELYPHKTKKRKVL